MKEGGCSDTQRGSLKGARLKGVHLHKIGIHRCQKNHLHSRKRNHPSTSSINNSIIRHYWNFIETPKPQWGLTRGIFAQKKIIFQNHLSKASIIDSTKCHSSFINASKPPSKSPHFHQMSPHFHQKPLKTSQRNSKDASFKRG